MRRRVSCAVTATPDSTTPAQTLVQTVGRLETRPRRKATDQFIDPAALPLIALVRSTQEVTKESQKACCVLFHDFRSPRLSRLAVHRTRGGGSGPSLRSRRSNRMATNLHPN